MEPNVFYEPWALLPAVSTVGADSELRFVVVSRPGEPSLLTGFFPVALRKRYLHLPERALTMWLHKHSALSTPLKKTSRTGARRQRD